MFRKWFSGLLFILLFGCVADAGSHGSVNVNAGSPLATNVGGAGQATEAPFFNWFKLGIGWFTIKSGDTGEEAYLYANCLDASGYPQHLPCQATGTFNATFNGTTTMVVNSLTSGVGPWLGGTLNVTGSPTIAVCPTGGCGITGSYTISATVSAATTSVTESPTFTELRTGGAQEVDSPAYPFYPGGAGSWTMFYDGEDNGVSPISWGGDFTVASHTSCSGGSTCADVLNVANPSENGFLVNFTYTDPNNNGNYFKNFRLVQTAQYNALSAADKTSFNSGGIYFNPDWVAQVQGFRGARFMDFDQTIANAITSWSQRVPVSWVFWSDQVHYQITVPYEVDIALANKLHVNPWINQPCLPNNSTADAYTTNLATLWLNNLDPSLSAVVEACNEIWNIGSFPSGLFNAMVSAGQALFPSCAGSGCEIDYEIYRAVRMADIWNSVWGTSNNRVTPVIGGNIGFPQQYQAWLGYLGNQDGAANLWTGTVASHLKGLTIAPYVCFSYAGNNIPISWSANPDAGIGNIYNQCGGTPILPSAVVAGNCGNGAGKTCTPVSNAAYTLTSGLSLPATPANGTCLAFNTNQDSAQNPTLQVDGGNVYPILNANDLPWMNFTGLVPMQLLAANFGGPWTVCFTNAVASVAKASGVFNATFNGTTTMVVNSVTGGVLPYIGGQLANVSGQPTITACPGGICGGTGNYTISGTVVSGTQSVTEQNVAILTGGSGYTNGIQVLTVQGGTCQLPIVVEVTVVSGSVVPADMGAIYKQGICTTAPTNPVSLVGAGGTGATANITYYPLTTGWLLSEMTPACGSELACTDANIATGAATASSYGLALLGYEGGANNLVDGCYAFDPQCIPTTGFTGNPPQDGMYLLFSLSPLMGLLHTQQLDGARANGMIEFYHFTDPGVWDSNGGSSYWGFNPGIYSSLSPTPKQLALYDWIRRNPCWWTLNGLSCRHRRRDRRKGGRDMSRKAASSNANLRRRIETGIRSRARRQPTETVRCLVALH